VLGKENVRSALVFFDRTVMVMVVVVLVFSGSERERERFVANVCVCSSERASCNK
jgi:hypothetical protein